MQLCVSCTIAYKQAQLNMDAIAFTYALFAYNIAFIIFDLL